MPELAEVAFYAKQWASLKGVPIARVCLHTWSRNYRGMDARKLLFELPGRTLLHWQTHGKQMLFGFSEGLWLGVHLGMTGKLYEGNGWEDPFAHLVLSAGDRDWVFSDPRQFGRIRMDINEEEPSWWKGFPPAILSEAFSMDYMERFLHRRRRSPIKSVLLMQECFPGIGNWMADEVCWRSRIDPRRLARSLSHEEKSVLYRELRRVCEQALACIGVDYTDPPDSWLFPHRWRDGGVCPKTGIILKRENVGGRTTCWSPRWQR